MATAYESFQKRRLRTSYFSVIVSISLVLFLFGILGFVVLQSSKVANHFKEEVVISLFLKDDAPVSEIEAFKNDLLHEDYVKVLNYISKEDAKKELGEDFLQLLGENPLKNLIELHLNADYVNSEMLKTLESKFQKETFIYEISYDKVLVKQLEKNIKKISFWLLIVCAFFVVIAILLINSSIRLSIYSKRFNIKTMQMVGATKSFIRRPFIIQSLKLGFIGSIIAILGLAVVVYYVNQAVPSFGLLDDYKVLIYFALSVVLMAFFITLISTFFAAQRFLNLHTNKLYE